MPSLFFSLHDQRVMASSATACLETNPDISGLGVRLSFYLQTIALVLLSGRSLDESLNSLWTLLGTSFGLTVSALVTAVQNELLLYQAIIVTDLVWLANFAIFMALATYNRHPKGSHIVQYVAIVQTYISMTIILYLWIRAAHLESVANVHIGETVFVVLFISTPATGRGRIIALVVTALLIAGYTIVTVLFLCKHLTPGPPKLPSKAHSLADTSGSHSPHSYPPSNPARPAPTTAPSHPRARGPNRLPPALDLDPHLSVLSLVFGIPYIITVVCTELQLKRNPLCSGNSVWGFGQILAMTVTIVPVFITLAAFRKHRFRQRSRNAKGKDHSPGGAAASNASLGPASIV